LTHNYQIQSSDSETQLSVTGIVVKSTPLGVRIIISLIKSCQSLINQSKYLPVLSWSSMTELLLKKKVILAALYSDPEFLDMNRALEPIPMPGLEV